MSARTRLSYCALIFPAPSPIRTTPDQLTSFSPPRPSTELLLSCSDSFQPARLTHRVPGHPLPQHPNASPATDRKPLDFRPAARDPGLSLSTQIRSMPRVF